MTIHPTTPLLTTDATSKTANVSKSYLNKARLTGDGPSFIKIGRAVRYELAEVERWITSKRRTSTSQK
jgi:predicted DNA-binding transcriptional regulator AlpA